MTRIQSMWMVLGLVLACGPLACESTSAEDADDDADTTPGDSDTADGGADAGTDDSDLPTDDTDDIDSDTYDGPPIPTSCEDAAAAKNSVGCEFYFVDMNNTDLVDDKPFAIVVANPQNASTATIKIEDKRGDGGTLRTVPGLEATLDPGDLVVFNVTCKDGCPVIDTGASILPNPPRSHVERSGYKARGAFRLTADVPVLAYQWNSYGDQMNSADASLLLPTTALAGRYIGATYPNGFEDTESATVTYERGELTVIGTVDSTNVTFTPTVDVQAGSVGGKPPALGANAVSAPIAINAFDILQIAAKDLHADLTGTFIDADQPVAVFGGHPCANAPSYEWYACDHVEEQLLPLRAWGTDAVLARYQTRPNVSSEEDQPIWRIVAGADAMTVTFDPEVPGVGASYSFTVRGEVLEFQSPLDHYAAATFDAPADPLHPEAPFFAYQVMTGRFWIADQGGGVGYQWGDPMMLLAPPAGQYLNSYVFTTDSVFDFERDQLILVRQEDYPITVDCLGQIPDTEFEPVGDSGFAVARVELDVPGGVDGCVDGAHSAYSDASFGLSVVGLDLAISYGYPGGIGVRWINPVEIE